MPGDLPEDGFGTGLRRCTSPVFAVFLKKSLIAGSRTEGKY